MRNLIGLGMFFLLSGCTSIEAPEASVVKTDNHPQKHTDVKVHSMDWIDYADPVADANIALEKNLFALLAVSNKGLSLPGVDLARHDLETLKASCGVKILETGGDAIYSKTQLEQRQAVVRYARQYNKILLTACLTRSDN